MNAHEKIHQVLLEEWTSRIADQAASGLSVKEWCSQNGFTIHKYNYWKHLIKEQFAVKALPDIVPLTIPEPVAKQNSHLSRELRNSHNSCNSHDFVSNITPYSPIVITIADIRIELSSYDIAFLPDIIKAVRNA